MNLQTADLEAAFQGAVTGGAFGYVGTFSNPLANYAGHALVGCASGAMNGGGGEGRARGAVSQVISKWVTVETRGLDSKALQFAVATMTGGAVSAITGGKFATGAQTAAFGYLFNELASQTTNAQRGYADSSTDRGASILYGPVEGGGLYDRMVFVLDGEGLVVATYRGSIDPDLARANCANGCPTIAAGTHAITAADRQKYGGTILVVGNNGTVPTEGPNPNQGGKSFATGVYVHTGYRTTTGAEGCLTINPAQWKAFISHFPTGARGTLTVVQ